jgi:hypothetical protein
MMLSASWIKHPFNVPVQCPMTPIRASIVGPPSVATGIKGE